MAKTGITFDANYKRLELAFKRMPTMIETSAILYTQRTAREFLRLLKRWIKNNELGLKPPKYRVGTPLYDTGELVKNLNILKRKKKYYVGASTRKIHRRSGLTMHRLLRVHEYGKMIKRGNALIYIPPRPAIRISLKRYLADATLRKKKNIDLTQAIRTFLMTNDLKAAQIIRKRAEIPG